jgi:hypothetical protein
MIKKLSAAVERASHNRVVVGLFIAVGAASAAHVGWQSGIQVGAVIFG